MVDIKSIHDAMRAGIANGEWFDIVYHGGSNPGSKRRIAPIALFTDRVRARCYTSNAVKPFMLEKIEILVSDEQLAAIKEWQAEPTLEPFVDMNDVRDLHGTYCDLLTQKGWSVDIHEYEYGWVLCLYGYWKNGKPKKTPKHSISYEHTSFQTMYDEQGNETKRFDIKPRIRPWGYRSATYKNPSVPIIDFLKAAGLTDDEIRR